MPQHPFYKTPFWTALRRAVLERDGYTCTVAGCGVGVKDGVRVYVDHIEPRPYSDHPTSADVATNLRTLCQVHDQQVRQTKTGLRRNAGRFRVPGCDEHGQPLDPGHHWNRA